MPDLLKIHIQSRQPKPGDPELAGLQLSRLTDACRPAVQKNGDSGAFSPKALAVSDEKTTQLIEAIFGHSPYLGDVFIKHPTLLETLVMEGPEQTLSHLLNDLNECVSEEIDEDGLKRNLRRIKTQGSAVIAWADIAGLWSLEQVTRALSDMAELTLSRAVDYALGEAVRRGAIEAPKDQRAGQTSLSEGSGLIVLGMGKLGAGELNYSSDIDIILLYDPDVMRTSAPDKLQAAMIRLARTVVRIMDERTADGYVFRTDLRLRPDPGSTPLALTVQAAEAYYESVGQNWERAAMIKARPIAGDREAGERFLAWLTPFIWRKNLDFAAIQDIHSIKRQINAARGGETLEVPGHNLKLGAGGIREIEFFAQTQQLIWGGRVVSLRQKGTKAAIDELVSLGHVKPETAEDLKAAYDFLRRAEHRLQMIRDEQTHSLPEAEGELEEFAHFLGLETATELAEVLTTVLRRVNDHYAALFADAPSLTAPGEAAGNLVFTGTDADPETLRTLEKLGFDDTGRADMMIRGWHHGRYRAMRSDRARALMTELMPCLLHAFGETPEPDTALLAFDGFLAGLPSGVQLLSLFHSNPDLLTLVAQLIGKAPRLARRLSERPHLIDYVLTREFSEPPPICQDLTDELHRQLQAARDFEDTLLLSRRWANDRRFQVGVQLLTRAISPELASFAFSDIADAALSCILPAVIGEFAEKHGHVDGAGMAVLALGRLGSRELTATSDLDLVFVYDPGRAETSDGPRPLPVGLYFGRLAQRYITALTALTGEGELYEVDMRLRPSGSKGPIATSMEAFAKYYADDAWTWERLALCRARVVCGDNGVKEKLARELETIHHRVMPPETLIKDAHDMRVRLAGAKPAKGFWDLKNRRGGLVDIAFVVQTLLCSTLPEEPAAMPANTSDAIDLLAEIRALDAGEAETLRSTQVLLHGLLSLLAMTMEGALPENGGDDMPHALKQDLEHVAGAVDFDDLKTKVSTASNAVSMIYDRVLATPATLLPPSETQAPLLDDT